MNEWNGVCVCEKKEADGRRCKYGASHARLETEMYKVYLTNFGWYLSNGEKFSTFEAACEAAKKAGFESQIIKGAKVVATWSVFGGLYIRK
jgi:hypothetical protein